VGGRSREVALQSVELAELRHRFLLACQQDPELIRLLRQLCVLTTEGPGGADHHGQEEHVEDQEPDPERDLQRVVQMVDLELDRGVVR
jgi:hypothetical protein